MDQHAAPTLPVLRVCGVASSDVRQPARVAKRKSVHAVCILAYRTHHDDGTGSRAACGHMSPCRGRRNAGSVIEAYADDPHRYDIPGEHFGPVAGEASVRSGVLRG